MSHDEEIYKEKKIDLGAIFKDYSPAFRTLGRQLDRIEENTEEIIDLLVEEGHVSPELEAVIREAAVLAKVIDRKVPDEE